MVEMKSKYGLRYELVGKDNWQQAFIIQKDEWPHCPDKRKYATWKSCLKDDNCDFIVYKGEELLGITGVNADEACNDSIWMSWFTVVPDQRGKGYGEQILRDTIEYCRQLGRYKYYRIDTEYEEGRPSTNLYEKVMELGEPYTAESAEGENCYIFSLALGDEEVTAWDNKYLGLAEYYGECERAADFDRYGIETVDDLFHFCQKLEYGWIDKEGKRHHGSNGDKRYFLQSPKELLENRIGICWDQTELQREYFRQEGVECWSYLVYYEVSEDNWPSHSILVYQQDGKYCWFEPMFFNTPFYYSGIHKYDTLKELLENFRTKFVRNGRMQGFLPEEFSLEKMSIYKYEKPEYGISDKEFYQHCRAGQEVIL